MQADCALIKLNALELVPFPSCTKSCRRCCTAQEASHRMNRRELSPVPQLTKRKMRQFQGTAAGCGGLPLPSVAQEDLLD
jgi:hypothetical protein